MKQPSRSGVRLNLKQLQAESSNVERLRATLRSGRQARSAPFAASGAKPPITIAPSRRA
jgi:hypothetical protein